MCSIFGVETRSIPYAQIQESFDQTVSRGPDSSKLIEVPCGLAGLPSAGHHGPEREGHAALRAGRQLRGLQRRTVRLPPRSASGSKAHYEFKSESDCEILLPLYREYGLEMFRTLDAEFALILYDAQHG